MPVSSSQPLVVLPIIGTRPEAVKMAPLVNLLKAQPENFRVVTCVTAQHRTMLDQVMNFFGVVPDFDLNIMKEGQTLTQVTSRALEGLESVLMDVKPDIVLAQGDTTTVLAASLAAAYQKIAFGHVEAGLRTDNRFDPFPEELNRRLTTQLTDMHFAPTTQSRDNLLREGVENEKIYLTGNTVIDALKQVAKNRVHSTDGRRMLLVTTHRRENWGAPLEGIALALKDILEAFPDTHLVLPMHKNPIVREPLQRILGANPRVELIEPPDYLDFVRLMEKSHLILTDSGGVQEEAPALGLPVLVLRRTTERPEGVSAGTASLIGTDRADIVAAASKLLSDQNAYDEMSHAANPYGDGLAGQRIAQAMLHFAGRGARPDDFVV
ncbi:MAG TPA: UDP-N-acetylglucosamine 2-epimerase (non-hydrolyzing) [Abditibacterium sp.]|jgi:UDP-N-acetylglucosamine 2-epimerase (non-hydrolysing)